MPTTRSAPSSRQPAPAPPRTLWAAGRQPGRLVVASCAAVLALVVVLDVLIDGRLGLLFDIALVLVSVTAALRVRASDFFPVGVMPPLLLAVTVVTLVVVDAGAVARAGDRAPQAIVSGLAHHALALVIGYAMTLAVLALRQIAIRNNGALRPKVGAAYERS